MKFKALLFMAAITLMISLNLYNPLPALAMEIPKDPAPVTRTPVEIRERNLQLTLLENMIRLESSYTLNNPTNKKKTVKLRLPFTPPSSTSPERELKVWLKGEEVKISFNARQKAYNWDITLEASEELELRLEYPLPDFPDNNGDLVISYVPSLSSNWAKFEEINTSLKLLLTEIHPGQVTDIKPLTYKVNEDSLSWNWKGLAKEKITFSANTTKELSRWTQSLSQKEKELLGILQESQDYLEIANFFNKKSMSAKKEEKEDLQVAQAYYLTKAQFSAGEVWEDLYQDKALSSRVYWELGKQFAGQTGKLLDLYQRAKELQVHPLTQSWLAVQIPPSRIKPSPPEPVLATAQLEEGNSGLVVKGHFSDKDGDIEQIILKYHWEDEPEQELRFDLEPFLYDYTPSQFIPAKKSLQRLFYEFIIVDRTGAQTTTGTKESFYLNSDIYSETYMLDGANLVLGDYAPLEQDEVRKWFMSYLKMAGDAQFVPIKAKNPYLIFLGKEHDFINTYKGPHFIMYTPVPFSPEATKLHVHRYFLSLWYGPGWQNQSDKELAQLGDALLLGKGRYAMVMKYLLHKDMYKFAQLLGTVGQGTSWNQALMDTYNLPFWRVQINTVWFVYGNSVLAVSIILSFAWLGKKGYLLRFISFFRKA